MVREIFSGLRGNMDNDVWPVVGMNTRGIIQAVGFGNEANGDAQSWVVLTTAQSPVLVDAEDTNPRLFLITLEAAGYILTGTDPTADTDSHYLPAGSRLITLLPGERISVSGTTLHISKCR